MSALKLVRRALALPPGEALRKAQRLALMRASELRQRLADAGAADPLAESAGGSWPGGGAAQDGGDVPAERLFRGDAVLPLAWPAAPPPLAPELLERVRFGARRALEHRFDLLGGGARRVDYLLQAPGLEGHVYRMAPGAGAAAAQLARMERLLPGSTRGSTGAGAYSPIDWHVDSRSGWRWEPSTWYRGIRYGRAPGADIKVPWELSRLQHAGALGLAWRCAPESPEGAAAPAEFVAQVVDWLAANPLRRGVNWACTMDVALRAVSWLAGLALLEGAAALTPPFRRLLARALHLHGRHIESNLEYDPDRGGNHYLSNVLGLVALGAALPDAPGADRWLAFGLQELLSESRRQILPDGADIEGSTAYHAFVLEMFLAGAAIARRLPEARRERLLRGWPAGGPRAMEPPLLPLARLELDFAADGVFPPELAARLAAAAELLAELADERGLLPQVGDHDSGRVYKLVPDLVPAGGDDFTEEPRDARQAVALAAALLGREDLVAGGGPYGLNALLLAPRAAAPASGAGGAPGFTCTRRRLEGPAGTLTLHPDAGLALGRRGGLRLLASFGRVPPAATGGHHHNDLLAFELSWRGVPFVVDGGTFVYTALPAQRDEFRRTAGHSTVAVQGREQRRWAPAAVSLFMVTADAGVATLAAEPGRLELECRYPGVVHRREWRWTEARLEIADTVEADAPASLVLNLAPGVAVEALPAPAGEAAFSLAAGAVRARLRLTGVASAEVGQGVYSAGYGRRIPNARIGARLAGRGARTEIEFQERPEHG